MTARVVWALVVGIGVAAWAQPAAADIPPAPGYVETCTVAKQEELGGGPCESASTLRGQVDPAVDQRLRARGLTPRCAGGGATVGSAVYCRGAARPSESPPVGEGCGRCAIDARRPGSGPGVVASTLAVLFAVAFRRRRPRHGA